jgi:hypothetical protein
MSVVDLASEMAAARERRARQTAGLLREARVQAIRGAVRPGSTRVEVEERARSFYPRLSEELLQEVVTIVSGEPPPEPEPISDEAADGEPLAEGSAVEQDTDTAEAAPDAPVADAAAGAGEVATPPATA